MQGLSAQSRAWHVGSPVAYSVRTQEAIKDIERQVEMQRAYLDSGTMDVHAESAMILGRIVGLCISLVLIADQHNQAEDKLRFEELQRAFNQQAWREARLG